MTTSQTVSAELIARTESVPFTRLHAKCRVVMGSATFFDAFSALSLAFALPVLTGLWHISPRQTGVLIAAGYLGQLAGAFLFTGLAERFGRVRSATAAVAVIAVMSFGCAFAASFPALLFYRLAQGIGIGGEMPVAAAYISELSQAQGRGRFFLLYEIIFPVGLMATGQVGAWLVPAWGWQAIFLVGGVPCVLVTILLARLPESPRWLISKGRLAEADAIIRRFEASAGYDLPAATAAPSIGSAVALGSLPRTPWSELFSESYRPRTLIVWALWFCAFFVANGLNNWMPSLYNTVYGLDLRQSLRAASLTNVAQVLLLLACAFSIDRVGRRNWTVVCFVLGAVLLGMLGLGGSHGVLSVMILATLSYGIVGSANAVLYLYTPEVYPTRMRAIGTGVATAWLRVASALAPVLVGVMVERNGIASVFVMFAGVSIAGALAATWMIEIRKQRLEEIAS